MANRPDSPDPRSDEIDPFGMDEAKQSLWSRSFGLVLPGSVQSLLPTFLAKRGLSVSVSTDRDTIAVGEPIEITIEIVNRLPISIAVPIEGKQLWGWTVDGLEAAREEARYSSASRSELKLEGRERRRHVRRWDGTFRRDGDPARWVDAAPGSYEITAYVPVERRPVRDSTVVTVR